MKNKNMKNIAVILSGCGYLDGTEIRESILTLLAIEQSGASYKIFAINEDQHHVVNHLTGEVSENQKRNVLEEAARIARGQIEDITKLKIEEFDALVIPGGFGVAKNLCKFAFSGSQAAVNQEIKNKIIAFKAANKPIGAICIAPALLALILGNQNPTLTIGTSADVAAEIEKTGVRHENCATTECVVDIKHKIVTTPAYMTDDAKLPDVLLGISKLVNEVIALSDTN